MIMAMLSNNQDNKERSGTDVGQWIQRHQRNSKKKTSTADTIDDRNNISRGTW